MRIAVRTRHEKDSLVTGNCVHFAEECRRPSRAGRDKPTWQTVQPLRRRCCQCDGEMRIGDGKDLAGDTKSRPFLVALAFPLWEACGEVGFVHRTDTRPRCPR